MAKSDSHLFSEALNIKSAVFRLASFPGNQVCRPVASDVTASQLVVSVTYADDLFNVAISLINGRFVTVNRRNCDFLQHVCLDLDNRDLFNDVFDEGL